MNLFERPVERVGHDSPLIYLSRRWHYCGGSFLSRLLWSFADAV
jgi:hypothetical protein